MFPHPFSCPLSSNRRHLSYVESQDDRATWERTWVPELPIGDGLPRRATQSEHLQGTSREWDFAMWRHWKLGVLGIAASFNSLNIFSNCMMLKSDLRHCTKANWSHKNMLSLAFSLWGGGWLRRDIDLVYSTFVFWLGEPFCSEKGLSKISFELFNLVTPNERHVDNLLVMGGSGCCGYCWVLSVRCLGTKQSPTMADLEKTD